MYNIVVSKADDGCFVSIFDQKGNEIYNTDAEKESLALVKVREQKFNLEYYIAVYDHCAIDNGFLMVFYNNYDPALKVYDASWQGTIPFEITEKDLIANESLHGYGLNRYFHRQFLKLTR